MVSQLAIDEQLTKMEAIHAVHIWPEMCQGIGVLHCSLCAIYTTCPWRLL